MKPHKGISIKQQDQTSYKVVFESGHYESGWSCWAVFSFGLLEGHLNIKIIFKKIKKSLK